MGGVLIGFLCSVPGLMVVLFLVAWWRQRARLAALQRVRAYRCCRCGASFDEAMLDYLGAVGPGERQRLDRFQRRFAAFTVRCLECGAVNLCTRDGTPFIAQA